MTHLFTILKNGSSVQKILEFHHIYLTTLGHKYTIFIGVGQNILQKLWTMHSKKKVSTHHLYLIASNKRAPKYAQYFIEIFCYFFKRMLFIVSNILKQINV